VRDVYLVSTFPHDDGKRHLSVNYALTLCGQKVGFEMSKKEWKSRPPCLICVEKA
jgi:hypothetical protein